MLPLMLNEVNRGRLTMEDIRTKMYENPRRIFGLPEQPDTYVEVDMDEEWTIPEAPAFSKARWTPFAGMTVAGKVKRVVLRGELAYVDGEVLVPQGYGQDVRTWKEKRTVKITVEEPPRIRADSFTGRGRQVTTAAAAGGLRSRSGTMSPARRPERKEPKVSPLAYAGRNLLVPMAGAAGAGMGASSVQGLQGRHVLEVAMFDRDILYDIFNLAETFRLCVAKEQPLDHILKGKILALMFYEASTRTSCSFAAAMHRLGGRVVTMDESNSSSKKGESLEDAAQVMSGYADVVVLRHPEPGAVSRAAAACRKPVINAGDGVGEHPTQALLDVFTIRSEIGTVKNLTVTLVGDLKHGRTVHSLARLLTLYDGVSLRYVSPKGLSMPQEVRDFVSARGLKQWDYDNLEYAIKDTDVLYVTRIQRERFDSEDEYRKACQDYVVNDKVMHHAQANIRVLHPLPRVFEISKEFDSDPRAAYFRQAENGLYVRMALLAMVLGK